MNDAINQDERLLAAIAYGESSTANDPNEIGGIAFAVANRCREWGRKTVTELKAIDPNYAYAWNGSNVRFNLLMNASGDAIKSDSGKLLALDWAKKALANSGIDPSNGAFWWDGLDFKTNKHHRKRLDKFKWGDPSHNIFKVDEDTKEVIVRWQIKNKKTGKIVEGSERGRYDSVWISTAAHGSTIFWKHNPDYVTATGGKAYR